MSAVIDFELKCDRYCFAVTPTTERSVTSLFVVVARQFLTGGVKSPLLWYWDRRRSREILFSLYTLHAEKNIKTLLVSDQWNEKHGLVLLTSVHECRVNGTKFL